MIGMMHDKPETHEHMCVGACGVGRHRVGMTSMQSSAEPHGRRQGRGSRQQFTMHVMPPDAFIRSGRGVDDQLETKTSRDGIFD